jgi:pyridoxamine 5'-phosphate oxidase
VLAKAIDDRGVVFYSNYTSAKSHDLDTNPVVAATIPWVPISRQVHLQGTIERVDPAVTVEYWESRPRMSQLGAWASPQSTVVADRAELEALMARTINTFGGADSDHPIPAPPFWGGWRIVPHTVEFWQGRTARMHDRLRYRHSGGTWVIERLAP